MPNRKSGFYGPADGKASNARKAWELQIHNYDMMDELSVVA